MTIKDVERTSPSQGAEDNPNTNGDSPKGKPENVAVAGAPDFGRSARIVGDWQSVDAAQTPHEKNKRGELGKPLFNWYFNRTGPDALTRIAFPQSASDLRNTLQNAVAKAPKGEKNPEKIKVTDPKLLTEHIKRVAEHFGADVVGITAVHPSMLYRSSLYSDDTGISDSNSSKSDKENAADARSRDTAEQYPFAISISTAWDYNKIQAHRHHIGDHAYHFTQSRQALIYANVAAYIQELGYDVLRNRAQPMPTALAAGIGELGRNGMLISEKFGARIHLGDPILTNMPLVQDKPLDIGVDDFCKVCRKCATTCPTNSISMEDKVVHNGVEKYKINWETCYRLRAHVVDFWEVCLTCVTVCPYTKPRTWWHTLAVQTLKITPFALRTLPVRALKFLDDTFWGDRAQETGEVARLRYWHYAREEIA